MARFRLALATVVALVLGGCQHLTLNLDQGFTCDGERCLDGYSCHPELKRCVPAVAAGCTGTNGSLCAAEIQTGDACPVANAFLPCSEIVTDCSRGCRTCGPELTWSACTTPSVCEGVRLGDDCGACPDRCLGFDQAQKTKCDVATGTPECKILTCRTGYVDANKDPFDGCEVRCSDSETSCNGVDDDCNGVVDDVPTDVLLTQCGAQYSAALNVEQWACGAGVCRIGTCTAGVENRDGDIDNGCEATCAPTNGGIESCDGVDNDCDGQADPPGANGCTNYYPDADNDGLGAANATPVCLCPGVVSNTHTLTTNTDCDDTKPNCLDGECRDGDVCVAQGCLNSPATCTVACGQCEEPAPGEPASISLSVLSTTGTAPRVATIGISLNGEGGPFTDRAARIACSLPGSQLIRSGGFGGADLTTDNAGFTNAVRTNKANFATNCGLAATQGAARLLGRGGLSCLTSATPTLGMPVADFSGWSAITLSFIMQNGGATDGSSYTCDSAQAVDLDIDIGTNAACAAKSKVLGSDCSQLSVVFAGRSACVGDDSYVDQIAIRANPPALGAVLPSGDNYQVTFGSRVSGFTVTGLRCEYDMQGSGPNPSATIDFPL